MKYFYSNSGENPKGPLSKEELVQLLTDGTMIGTAMIVPEGGAQNQWVPVSSLFPESAPASSTSLAPIEQKPAKSSSAAVQYKVSVLTTGCLSKTLDPAKLQSALNEGATGGWRFTKSIHEEKKILGIFAREAHFLIFEKEG